MKNIVAVLLVVCAASFVLFFSLTCTGRLDSIFSIVSQSIPKHIKVERFPMITVTITYSSAQAGRERSVTLTGEDWSDIRAQADAGVAFWNSQWGVNDVVWA